MKIASVDIGRYNFAICIEEFDEDMLTCIDDCKGKRYERDGTPTEAMDDCLKQVCYEGKIIYHSNNDLTKGDKKLSNNLTMLNMTEFLNSIHDLLRDCSYFLVEQQMNFGKFKTNKWADRYSHHCQSHFLINYGDKVVEYPSYNKTQVLGAPKTKKGNRYTRMNKSQRKKWAVVFAKSILDVREPSPEQPDIVLIKKKRGKKKKQDDLADCFIQMQAWKYQTFVCKK